MGEPHTDPATDLPKAADVAEAGKLRDEGDERHRDRVEEDRQQPPAHHNAQDLERVASVLVTVALRVVLKRKEESGC